jgi:undecaprenyl-diphosphatase
VLPGRGRPNVTGTAFAGFQPHAKHIAVKARSFAAPRVLVSSAAQFLAVLHGFWSLARRLWWSGPLVLALSIVVACVLFPLDHAWLDRLHALYPAHDAQARRVAWFFGTFGDYPTYNLPLSLALWVYGCLAKKSAWRRLAVICFLGGTFAGLLDDCFRLTLGRPRPDAHMPDGFYGFPEALRGRCQSFPSGHAAAVFGTSMALLMADLPLGILTTLYALVVIWARMELDRHYPSDVLVGALIGIWLGLLVGCGARRGRFRPVRSQLVPVARPTPVGQPVPVR